MTVITTYKPPKFKVIANRAAGFTGTWTITEDDRFDCPGNWNTHQGAVDALARCRTEADRIVSGGYHHDPLNSRQQYIYLGDERVDLVMPYGLGFSTRIRTAVIRTTAMQWLIDQEPGDTP